jgi:2-methylcitrate dehydratase PrpD
LKANEIQDVELRVHPLVLELTGKKAPQSGLEGKFSVYYATAVAIVEGAAGEKQFSDRLLKDPEIIALRDRVHAVVDPAIHEEQVRIAIRLKDGRRLEKFVEHAIGSVQRPMTDSDLEAKFDGLVSGVLPQAQSKRVIDLCWRVETLVRVGDLAKAARSRA